MINLCLDKTYCPRRSMMEMFFCDHPESDCLLFAYIMSQNQQLGIFNMYMMNHPCLPTSSACSTIAAVRKIQPKTYICCTNATKHSKSKHANDVRLASPAIKETCIFSSFAHFPVLHRGSNKTIAMVQLNRLQKDLSCRLNYRKTTYQAQLSGTAQTPTLED